MPVTESGIIDSARQACESYFLGEFKSRRSIRMDMEELRALIREWDAKQDTTTISRSHA